MALRIHVDCARCYTVKSSKTNLSLHDPLQTCMFAHVHICTLVHVTPRAPTVINIEHLEKHAPVLPPSGPLSVICRAPNCLISRAPENPLIESAWPGFPILRTPCSSLGGERLSRGVERGLPGACPSHFPLTLQGGFLLPGRGRWGEVWLLDLIVIFKEAYLLQHSVPIKKATQFTFPTVLLCLIPESSPSCF